MVVDKDKNYNIDCYFYSVWLKFWFDLRKLFFFCVGNYYLVIRGLNIVFFFLKESGY